MLRNTLKENYIGMEAGFRYRGKNPGRIEAVTDAGFALAIGLLLISTRSPENLGELFEFTRDLLPFAMCISLIMLVWYQHYIFFLRYGFRNAVILTMNTALIFIVLFYVYPLKFLARLLVPLYASLIGGLFGASPTGGQVYQKMIGEESVANLMAIYGLGAAGTFIVLTLMYRYALTKSVALELNELEVFDTRTSIYANLIMASIPFASVLLALTVSHKVLGPMLSGFIYFLYFPCMVIFGRWSSHERNRLLHTPQEAPVPKAPLPPEEESNTSE